MRWGLLVLVAGCSSGDVIVIQEPMSTEAGTASDAVIDGGSRAIDSSTDDGTDAAPDAVVDAPPPDAPAPDPYFGRKCDPTLSLNQCGDTIGGTCERGWTQTVVGYEIHGTCTLICFVEADCVRAPAGSRCISDVDGAGRPGNRICVPPK